MIKSIAQLQSNDRVISQLQNNIATPVNQLIGNPIVQGQILQNISLINGTNYISHKLGRVLQGWILIRKRAGGSIYDNQTISPPIDPALTLVLVSDSDVDIDLYVF